MKKKKTKRTRLKEIYSEIPQIQCKQDCCGCCGVIFFSPLEYNNLPEIREYTNGTQCPYVEDNKCSIYDVRPFICRLFGTVISMPCPYGCKPEHLFYREDEKALMRKYQKISGGKTRGLKPFEDIFNE